MAIGKEEFDGALGDFLSRRQMLQLMGLGAAGAMLAPRLLARPRLATPPGPVWLGDLPGYTIRSGTSLATGQMVIAAFDSNDNSVLLSVDAQTSAIRWSASTPSVAEFFTPAAANGVIYVATDTDGFQARSEATGSLIWSRAYAATENAPVIAGERVIFTTNDGAIVVLTTAGDLHWSYATGEVSEGPVGSITVSAGMVVAAVGSKVFAIDLLTGAFVWSYVPTAAAPEGITASSDTFYFTAGNTISAVSRLTGQHVWTSSLPAGTLSPPNYYSGSVYFAHSIGRFYALDPATGAQSWSTAITGYPVPSTIFVEEGVAFVPGFTNTITTQLQAIDLASKGTQPLAAVTLSGLQVLVGVESGVCYHAGFTNQIGSVDLLGLVHQVFVETELMTESYVRTAAGRVVPVAAALPSYRTHLQFFDPSRNPRIGKSIKVWASGPVTITSGGSTYALDVNKSTWLRTDSSGELAIVCTVPADQPTFTMPALYLWGNFMETGEAIVVYPDHDTLNTLSKTTAAALTAAKGYDGQPLLPAAATSFAPALAGVITNLLGNPTTSLANTQRSLVASVSGGQPIALANKYIAYPGSSTNLLYQPTQGSAARQLVVGPNKNWTATFNANGVPVFNPNGPTSVNTVGSGLTFTSIDDFVRNVVRGAAKITQIVFKAAADITHAIKDSLGNVYNLTVRALEDAVHILNGVLKTVLGDLKKAVQWLGYVFDWQAILNTKTQIDAMLTTRFNTLKGIVDSLIDNDIAKIRTFFQNAQTRVVHDLNSLTGAFGNTTFAGQQVQGNNPQAVYGMNGSKSYTKSRWLSSTFKENSSKSGPVSTQPDSNTDLVVGATQTFHDSLVGVPGTPGILEDPSIAQLPSELKTLIADLFELVTDPSKFTLVQFEQLLDALSGIAVSLLKLTELAIEMILGLIKQIFDAVLNLFQQHIHVPVLSPLYTAITGSTLSALDLISLLVAIPTSIITRATSTASAHPPVVGSGPADLLKIGALFAGFAYAAFDTLSDAFPDTGVFGVQIVVGASSLALLLFNLGGVTSGASYRQKAFYGAQFIPVATATVGAVFNRVPVLLPLKQAYDGFSRMVSSIYGMSMIIHSVLMAVDNECGFQGTPRNYILGQNIVTYAPSYFKFIGAGGKEGDPRTIILAAIDGLCDVTTVIMTSVHNYNNDSGNCIITL
ncbi:MAG TPA: PQQ-binding-like beta-propeller repeat protein [Pyrinomonadaceae bacterium]|nr:PQQ-binding-like beta-propeller repeat protein [Pyrinomonadaceae bacterium]